MSNRRFEMYEYRAVLVRMRQGDSDRAIARSGLMGRSKVRRFRALADFHGWLESGNPLPGEEEIVRVAPIRSCPQSTGSSSVEPYRAQVESWVREGIQVTTIQRALERIHGYRGSYSSVNRFVRDLCIDRPRATVHLTFEPGEAGQVDFGAGPRMVDVRSGEELKTWFFLMTLAFSRHQYAELVLDQRTETWLECHRRAFEWFGGVPARIIIDNARCAITRACFHDPVAQRAYAEYAEGYRFRINACPPRDPKKKGRVEAGIQYLKRGFVPTREFRSLADANNCANGSSARRATVSTAAPASSPSACSPWKGLPSGPCRINRRKPLSGPGSRSIRMPMSIMGSASTRSLTGSPGNHSG